MAKKIIILAVCLLLVSCDRVELEDRGIVITLGIEKYEEQFRIYAAFPDAESKQFIISGMGKTVDEALSNIDSQIRQSIYYGHTRVCIISEEVLNDNNMLKNIIESFEENKELSGRIIMLAAKDSIDTILNTDVREMTGIYISSFYDYSKNTTKVDFTDMSSGFYAQDPISLPHISVVNNNLVILSPQ